MTPKLFEHPIQLERSDIRIHVSPATRRLYVFQTAAAQKLLEERGDEFPDRMAYQADVDFATARGKPIPCGQMPTLRVVKLAAEDWWAEFAAAHTTSKKGVAAARLVERALREGWIPLPYDLVVETKDLKLQRSGLDIQVWAHHRIQVKCDWKAGSIAHGGSGNLFLQQAELNPKGRY